MAQPFPYTYYSCPCIDTSAPSSTLPSNRKTSQQNPPPENDEEEHTFDPRSPRANYSLFPLEHLLYCTECHEIRCARCMVEEVVCWYCPTCLFEVPSSTVRSEGNRCTRNCYNCPICTAPLTVNPLEAPSDEPKSDSAAGPFIFACGYCNWTSLDIGIKFEKHTNITSQLKRIKNGGKVVPPPGERGTQADRLHRRETNPDIGTELEERDGDAENSADPPDADELFANLTAFYRNQILENAESSPLGSYGSSSDLAFSSPSSITRLLNLYSGKKTRRAKPRPMREALAANEGFQIFDPESEDAVLAKLHAGGWDATVSSPQREFQEKHSPHFIEDLRPVASLLRTKRAKRCKTCRTLLARPEPKVSSTRYRIKVLALNNIPKVGLRSLLAPPTIGPYLGNPQQQAFAYDKMTQLQTYQFLFTIANPLFDPVRVTLATPAETPGRVKSRVTILCPEFDVGANSDVWDEALNAGGASKRKSMMPGAGLSGSGAADDDSNKQQAEAGKIWGKGRNWTSVIVEIVPGMLPSLGDIEEDEDLLEIPVFVRIEYETDAGGEEKAVAGSGGKEKREEAFWCVLGVGRIKWT